MSLGQRGIDNDNVHSDRDDHYYDYKEKDNSDDYDDDEKDNLHNMIMTMIMTMRRMTIPDKLRNCNHNFEC